MNLIKNINFLKQKTEKTFFYIIIFLIISYFIFWFLLDLKLTKNILLIKIIFLVNIFILIFLIIFMFFKKRGIFVKYNFYIINFFLIFSLINVFKKINTSKINEKFEYSYLIFFINLLTTIMFLTFYIIKKRQTILNRIEEKEKKIFCYFIITFVFLFSFFLILNNFIKFAPKNQKKIIENINSIKQKSKSLYYLKKIELVIYPSIMEELLFRFFICGLFVKKKNKIIAGTLLFAIMHCGGLIDFENLKIYLLNILSHLFYFIFSFFLCYVHLKTKKIRYNFFFHGLNNLFAVIFI